MPNDVITPFILAVPKADLALDICGFSPAIQGSLLAR